MSNIVKEVKLICADVTGNKNKYYYARYFDDGTAESTYGRIGLTSQITKYPSHRALDIKVNSKARKGYKPLRVVEAGVNVVTPAKSELHQIAIEQICGRNSILEGLIKRLVEANVHAIIANSQITYNKDTGLFSTPLGILEKSAIDEARALLADLSTCVTSKTYNAKCIQKLNEYLSLVPTNVGMKRVEMKTFLPDADAVQKQLGILDSLDASLLAISKPVIASDKTSPIEKVFSVKLGILQDQQEKGRIEKWFYGTKKAMHHYDSIKIQEIYELDIEDMSKRFDESPGNIQEVFHASSMANCLSILKQGMKIFPPATAKLAGALFARGLYGTQTSSKALGYTMNRWGQGMGDSGFCFICSFVMGKPYYPNTYGISGIPAGYDSCWALPEKTKLLNDELIVYSENRAKVKYLLEVK